MNTIKDQKYIKLFEINVFHYNIIYIKTIIIKIFEGYSIFIEIIKKINFNQIQYQEN